MPKNFQTNGRKRSQRSPSKCKILDIARKGIQQRQQDGGDGDGGRAKDRETEATRHRLKRRFQSQTNILCVPYNHGTASASNRPKFYKCLWRQFKARKDGFVRYISIFRSFGYACDRSRALLLRAFCVCMPLLPLLFFAMQAHC